MTLIALSIAPSLLATESSATNASIPTESIHERSPYYIGGFGTIGFQYETHVRLNEKAAPLLNIILPQMNFKPSVGFGVMGGYHFAEYFSTELELSFRGGQTNVKTTNWKESGYVSYSSLMANGVFHLPLFWDFSLEAGAGLGLSYEYITQKLQNQSRTTLNYRSYSVTPAIQFLAGLSYAINEHWSLFTGYKLFFVPAHYANKFNYRNGQTSRMFIDDSFTHSIELGARYRF